MGDKCNCYRFSPRDSLSGAVAQIADYLSKHPGWNETELRTFIDGLISATGVESFNGRTGTVTLDKNDVNNLKIASAYFAEGDESIDSLDLVSLYNQGVRFVFTDFNSVTHGYNLAFALEYFSGSGNVVYYPMSTSSGGGGNIVSVNGKTGEVRLKVVDVSNGNSPDENAYIFIDESDDYPDVISSDSNKLGGQLPSYYASAEEVSQLKNDKANKADVLSLEEIQASTDLSGKIASASAIKTAIDNINSNLGRIRVFFGNTLSGADSVTFGPVRISGSKRAGLLIGNANYETFFDYITVSTVNTNNWNCANHSITGVFVNDYTFTITIKNVSAFGNYWLIMFD